jgi:hypothetical protein
MKKRHESLPQRRAFHISSDGHCRAHCRVTKG